MTEEMTTLVKQYERLIYKIASKFSPKYPIEDLFQVGVIGLINAKKNYKSNQGTKFITYAYQYVLGEMLDFIKKDRTIKVSKDSLKIYKLYEQAKETLAQRKKQIPTFSEICEFLELDEETVYDAIKMSEYVLSTDSSLREDENTTFIETCGEDRRETIDSLLDLKIELMNLPEFERKLVDLRYFKDYTQSETATILGISQVQVSRNEKHILAKIKKNIVC